MGHRKRHEDHPNHEAWAIPYADLLTLLLAFFVVMYAISAVDAGKYRVMSNSLLEAFGVQVQTDVIEAGDPSISPDVIVDDKTKRTLMPMEIERRATEFWHLNKPTDVDSQTTELLAEGSMEEQLVDREGIRLAIADIADEIEDSLSTLIEDDVIKVHRESYWLEIEINTNLLFPSGSAVIAEAARPVLVEVAHILANRPLRIHVEGHTDDVPISSSVFPSNWELSSGRAASVVHLFAENGINPRYMVAMGYGEFQPVANNTDAEGRARNRRVAVVVLPGELSQMASGGKNEPERVKSDYQALGVSPNNNAAPVGGTPPVVLPTPPAGQN
ncbi:flagellar motor protein MotD [Thiospirillum jenense]|uniref:Flagellar motor protein MotD n=1 Tax=Thiospirillum jenense TaxID=1653858 RepID=A0A839HAY6_9GAMM|nr:flagellar motor protein MotD [Thiospirillum jenense]MBB1125784.1 flagellar motor protein MotD [Thiospirillum jenense]